MGFIPVIFLLRAVLVPIAVMEKPMGQTQQRAPAFDVHLPVWVHTSIAHTLHDFTVCKCKDS